MSILKPNELPAELARGLQINLDLSSAASVAKQNGTVAGSPKFGGGWGKYGIELDGTSDYLTYNLTGEEFNSAEISIVMEFKLNTDHSVADGRRFYYDTNAANRYAFQYEPGADDFRFIFNGVTLKSISRALWETYYLSGQRNVLVMFAESSGTSYYYLNGSFLGSSGLAWTPGASIKINVGARNNGSEKFDGTIHSFKVFNQLLTADEAKQYYVI